MMNEVFNEKRGRVVGGISLIVLGLILSKNVALGFLSLFLGFALILTMPDSPKNKKEKA